MSKRLGLDLWGRAYRSATRGDIGVLILLAILTVGYHWRVVFTGDYTLVGLYDTTVQNYAWSDFAARAVSRGVLPLWDPFTYSGRSFIGEGQAGLFYPFNLLLFYLSRSDHVSVKAMEMMILFHQWLAAALAYACARSLGLNKLPSLTCGIVFAFGGFIAGRANTQLNIFFGAVWLPAAFWAFRRSIQTGAIVLSLLAGLFIGLAVLAGHIQPAFHIALVLVGYAVFCTYHEWQQSRRLGIRPIALLGVVGMLTLMVSAVQMLPQVEYLAQSFRWVGVEEPVAAIQKIPYWIAGDLHPFAPRFFASFALPELMRLDSELIDTNPYIGVLPLMLAAAALLQWKNRTVRFFLLVAVGSFLLAMGSHSIFHGWLYALGPGSDKLREAVRSLYPFHFAIAILAGFGLQTLMLPLVKKAKRVFSRFVRLLWQGLGAFAVVAVPLYFWGLLNKSDWASAWGNSAFFFMTVSFAAVLCLTLRRDGIVKARGFGTLAILIMVFDLFSLNSSRASALAPPSRATTQAPSQYYAESEALRFLRRQAGLFRIDNTGEVLPSNFGDVFGMYEVMGHSASMLIDYFDFRSQGWAAPSKVHDLLNVRYIASPKTLANLPLVLDGQVKLYENPTYMPRAWVVHNVQLAGDLASAETMLFDPGFDIRERAVVTAPNNNSAIGGIPLVGRWLTSFLFGQPDQTALAISSPRSSSTSAVTLVDVGIGRTVVEAEMAADGLLVLSETYYPGWRARVNGEKRPIHKADAVLRGVYLAPGKQRVEFVYDPVSFKLGAGLTATALAITVVAGAFCLVPLSRAARVAYGAQEAM